MQWGDEQYLTGCIMGLYWDFYGTKGIKTATTTEGLQYKWISVDRTIATLNSVISMRVIWSDGFGKLKYLCVYFISKKVIVI